MSNSNMSTELIRDGRLAERILINDKIIQLVHTVIDALEESNPESMNKLLNLANDQERLKEIVQKPHIQNFLSSLNHQNLVSRFGHLHLNISLKRCPCFTSSCEAFHLTKPFKTSTIPLLVQTSSNSLENLVKQIRKNILQMPSHGTFNTIYQNDKRLSQTTSESTSYSGTSRIQYPSPRGSFLKKISEDPGRSRESFESSLKENPIYNKYYGSVSQSGSLRSGLSAQQFESSCSDRNLLEMADIKDLATFIR